MWCAFPAAVDGDLSAMVLTAMVAKLLMAKVSWGTVVGGEVLGEAGLMKPALFAVKSKEPQWNAAPAGKWSAWVQPIMLNMKEPKVMRVVEGNVVVVMKVTP